MVTAFWPSCLTATVSPPHGFLKTFTELQRPSSPCLSSVWTISGHSPVRDLWLHSEVPVLSWLEGRGLLAPSPCVSPPEAAASPSSSCTSVCSFEPKARGRFVSFTAGKWWWVWPSAAALPLLNLLRVVVFFGLFWTLFVASASPAFFFAPFNMFAHNSLKSLSCSSIGFAATLWGVEGRGETPESVQMCISPSSTSEMSILQTPLRSAVGTSNSSFFHTQFTFSRACFLSKELTCFHKLALQKTLGHKLGTSVCAGHV